MSRLLSLALIIGFGVFVVATAQAMPQLSFGQPKAETAIPVAGGCGAGWHRGPSGVCRPNGYYGGIYYGGPVVAPGVVVVPPPVVVAPGRCGGRGTHRVCDAVRCWRVCNY